LICFIGNWISESAQGRQRFRQNRSRLRPFIYTIMSAGEDDLVATISDTLESHGYLPRVRAGLKLLALKTAQELAKSNPIQQTDAVLPKHFDSQDDAVQIQLCKNLFEILKLEHAAEMLSIEAESPDVNLAKAFPGAVQPQTPVLLSLIERAQRK
jgi:hypothetical protein